MIDVEITTFRKESIHIHFLRLLGLCLHPEVNRRIRKAMSNIHVTNQVDVEVRETSIKSDTTIRNKMNATKSLRNKMKPRSAHTLDVIRSSLIFETPDLLQQGIDAIVTEFSTNQNCSKYEGEQQERMKPKKKKKKKKGKEDIKKELNNNCGGGIGRVHNGFALSEVEVSHQYHYRSIILDVIVDFETTYASLISKSGAFKIEKMKCSQLCHYNSCNYRYFGFNLFIPLLMSFIES
mgnify:CR=1 FL=1